MKRIISKICSCGISAMFFGMILTALLSGCVSEVVEVEDLPTRNILFYIAGDESLIDSDIYAKLYEIRAGWRPGRGEMIIYVDRQTNGAALLRINGTMDSNGIYGLDTVAPPYGKEDAASPTVLNRVINQFLTDYKADCYGFMFFSHGSGWLPSGTLNQPRSLVIDKDPSPTTEMEYTEFASAIPSGKFDFIILEACLMADVMTMYELREKADYILASSAEIVSPGFTHTYRKNIMTLYNTKYSTEDNLKSFGQAFHNYIIDVFGDTSEYCSSTMSLIKTDELGVLAATVKSALKGTRMDESTLTVDSIQTFDRPRKLINSSVSVKKSRYYDLDNVVDSLASTTDYNTFVKQLNKTVVWKAATKRFLLGNYSNGTPDFNSYDGFFIKRHCGLTTYIERSEYTFLNSKFEESSWYKAIY